MLFTVESTTTGDVRLVEGSSQGSGYVEVYYKGLWNTVCVENSAYDVGNAACKQLGYRLVSKATKADSYLGPSSDSITVNCYGSEDRMDECNINSNCYSSYRLFVECTSKYHTVRVCVHACVCACACVYVHAFVHTHVCVCVYLLLEALVLFCTWILLRNAMVCEGFHRRSPTALIIFLRVCLALYERGFPVRQ